jgi:uncharacterized protein YhfF
VSGTAAAGPAPAVPDELPVTEFGLSPASKDAGARKVLAGRKRATTSLLAAYAHDGEAPPVVGRRSMVRDGRGRDVAVIAVTRVEVRRFRDVDAAYAVLEADDLAAWQRAHWRYLGAECARVGVPLTEDAAVLLEYFEVVQPLLTPADF